MPKAPRSPEEIEAVKADMLGHTLDLIVEHGLEGFSMRKLAARLNIAAKTIYNYFTNKDEMYLTIVARGFDMLFQKCREAYDDGPDPIGRLHLIARAYMDFGIENANFYNLMFTWHTPKYMDYVGTPMEPVARIELETSLKLYGLILQATREVAGPVVNPDDLDEEAKFYVIYFWSLLHGFIAGYNNTMLDYMHDAPLSLKEKLMETFLKNIRTEIAEWSAAKNEN